MPPDLPLPGTPPRGNQPTSATHCDCLWYARYKTNTPCEPGTALCFKVVGYYPLDECRQKRGTCHARRPALEEGMP